jgi:hypothetical protein
MCFAVSINVLPWSLMFSSNYKCFAVADMGHRIYLQNGIVFMNDFLSIYSMSILTYLYVETTAYKFRIYSMITMKELAK